MVQVLAILPNDQAIISTRSLYRLVNRETGEPVAELLESWEAIAHAAGYGCASDSALVITSYSDAWWQGKSDAEQEGRTPIVTRGPELLAALPGVVVVSSRGLRRVVAGTGSQPEPQVAADLCTKSRAKRIVAKLEKRVDAREPWSIVRYDDVAPCGLAVDVARGRVIDGSGDVEAEAAGHASAVAVQQATSGAS